jgi:hypothetical protein
MEGSESALIDQLYLCSSESALTQLCLELEEIFDVCLLTLFEKKELWLAGRETLVEGIELCEY